MNDELRDTIAQAIADHNGVPHRREWYVGQADAVLGVLHERGLLDPLRQVGWLHDEGRMFVSGIKELPEGQPKPEGWQAVFVKEPTDG